MPDKNEQQFDAIKKRISELKATQKDVITLKNSVCQPFEKVLFEISGACNAICPWCERGARARKMLPALPLSKSPKFISAEAFTHRLKDLLERKIIAEGAMVYLYNWGEPLLNPDFYKIVDSVRELGFHCGISTNGSRFLENHTSLSHVSHLCISMSGFSQETYDRVHGFSFEKTKREITRLVTTAKKAGCKPSSIQIYGHSYRFNQHEIPLMKEFAAKLGITFKTNEAYFNSSIFFTQYMQGELPPEILEKAKQELYLFDPTKVSAFRPNNYHCPQFDSLTLSHTGKMSLCCGTRLDTKEYELLDFNEHPNITLDEIYQIRKNNDACLLCQELGIDWVSNTGHASDIFMDKA